MMAWVRRNIDVVCADKAEERRAGCTWQADREWSGGAERWTTDEADEAGKRGKKKAEVTSKMMEDRTAMSAEEG
jgi:hypothetical protein